METISQVNRRQFLQFTGLVSGGIMLGASLNVSGQANKLIDVPPGTPSEALAFNLFVQISPDGQVYIVVHRSEMGQGIRTGLPQVVADELEADWQRITVVQGLANNKYGSQNTDGSNSIRDFYSKMREMGAAARAMLVQAAANQWQVPVQECFANQHKIIHKPTGKNLGFGDVAVAAALLPVPKLAELTLKSSDDFKYIGKPVPVVDLQNFVTGDTEFGIDVDLPGMVYASIQRCPVVGGHLKTLDSKATKAVKGVLAVLTIEPTPLPAAFNALPGVAVIADNTWAANQGREKLKLEWDAGANGTHDSDEYMETLKKSLQSDGRVVRSKGDVDRAFDAHTHHVSAQYTVPYLAHAPMEPTIATAVVNEQGIEIWTCTQNPQATRDAVAAKLEVAPEKIVVHVTLLGGAFGRKSKPDYAVEAALLSKQLGGKPVKVTWTREDDIQFDFYHAISAQQYKAALNENGKVIALEGRTAFPSISSNWSLDANFASDGEVSLGFVDMPFELDNLRLQTHRADTHIRIGWMRSVSNIQHGFAINSFVGELAQAAGRDSREMLLELLGSERMIDLSQSGVKKYGNYGEPIEKHPLDISRFRAAVVAVTDSAGWGSKTTADEGWGLAVHRSFVSYVAIATRVKVSKGKVEVKEVHCVADCGLVVNPDRVEAQMEGAVIFGLSIALMGEIKVKNGAVVNSNFHDYPVLRINQTPAITVTLLQGSEIPGGVGEPGVPPVAASVTNAIVAAGGPRIRDLPISGHLLV